MAAENMTCVVALDFLFDETHKEKKYYYSDLPLLLSSQEERKRIQHYWETIIPLYDNASYQRIFRMYPNTLEELCKNLFPYMDYNSNLFQVPYEKKVMMAIYYLGHTDSYFLIADKFDVGESTVKRSVDTVCDALVAYAKKVIKWPDDNRRQQNLMKFQRVANYPGVIGAIDGCHVPIKTPQIDKECYYNRKKFFSIVLQAVCDSELLFMDCFVGYPGSVHDARVFRSSDICHRIKNDVDGMMGTGHLLGDCAYKLEPWLMTPFRDNGLMTHQRRQYNYLLSKTRVCIERSFALLKGRYRRLKYVDMNNTGRICAVIMACCVLHIHCLLHEDLGQDFIGEYEVEEHDIQVFQLQDQPEDAAKVKRNLIMNTIV